MNEAEELKPLPVINGPTFSEQIRSAMRRCSLPGLARASGINRATLWRFMQNEQSLSLSAAERLLEAMRCTCTLQCDLPGVRRLVRLTRCPRQERCSE
jgi:hypothetical protein